MVWLCASSDIALKVDEAEMSPAYQIDIFVSHFTLREGRKGALLLCEQRGLSTLFFTRLNNSLAVAYALVPAAGGRSVSELMND